jgi:dTDP-4-amino-4,6-dideoxygalactose transaminase
VDLKKIWLSSPHMGSEEFERVREAFDTNWIAPLGPHVDGFERDLQEYTGVAHAAALSSGTAAIHLALIILGVQRGDYVLCQSFTFSGSANPIAYMGATPVFVDSEPDSWNMCPAALERAILDLKSQGKRAKVVIPVHLYGMPARMPAITEVARRHDLYIVEDAAEALGSTLDGKPCGSFGDISILSFNGNKIITTSGGGALLSNRADWVQHARFLSTQARDAAPHYQHSQIGYNYRMSNVCAGIGRGQMTVLNDRVEARRGNHAFYEQSLSDLPGFSFLPEPDGCFSNRWLTCVLIDPERSGGVTRETVRLALDAQNIESRPLWKPMHMQPIFADAPYYGNGTSERLFMNGLCLPSGSNLSETDLQRVVKQIKTAYSNHD